MAFPAQRPKRTQERRCPDAENPLALHRRGRPLAGKVISMPPDLDVFFATWRGSAGNERANFQSFLRDFCAELDLPMPEPKEPDSTYCFEKDLKLTVGEARRSAATMEPTGVPPPTRRLSAKKLW